MAGYRAPEGEQPARAVAVAHLPAEALGRLSSALRGGCLLPSLRPSLLLPREAVALLALTGLALAAATLAPRFGSPEPPRLSRASRTALLGFGLAALGASAAFGARRARLGRGLPIDPGVHLLARDLIDAREAPLVVRPLASLRDVADARGPLHERQVKLTFEGGAAFVFPAGNTSAHKLRAELGELGARAERAESEGDRAELERLDPLHGERARLGSCEPAPIERGLGPSWPLPIASLLVPIAAAWLAAPITEARDRASERAAFEAALASGDDDELGRFSAEGGTYAERADQARRQRALEARTPEALAHYLLSGGLHPGPVDDALFEASVADGSVASLERYLRVGRGHRDQVFDTLLGRGVDQNDVAALKAYERERGPKLDEVTRGLLPRAELLSAGAGKVKASQLRQAVSFASHPLHREAARRLLRERIDARLAQLGPAADGSLDLRALLAAVRDHDGRASLSFERVATRKPDPRLASVDQAFPRLAREALEQALERALEPGMVKLEEQGDALPVLGVSYEVGPVPSWKPVLAEGEIPARVTLSLAPRPGSDRRLVRASSATVTAETAEEVFAVMRCPPQLRGLGCHFLRPLEVFEARALALAPESVLFGP